LFTSTRRPSTPRKHKDHVNQYSRLKPAGRLATLVLFGGPAAIFWCLFHVVGPALRRNDVSWWLIFQILLLVPLGALLLATYWCVRHEIGSAGWAGWMQRLRVDLPNPSVWIWAIALSGFMHGGDWEDGVAVLAAWLALWQEQARRKSLYVAILLAVVLKRELSAVEPMLRSVAFFPAQGFQQEFFSHFGPVDFMGLPLTNAWWLLIYYGVWLIVFNVLGEELWWRGYVLPRQQQAFGRATWIIHGICWSLFHLFIQPTLWDTTRMATTGVALAYVAQRTRSTWPGIVGHGLANTPLLISIAGGVL
jgi:membrane protease YdiL (CAAX protease family)